VAACACPLAVGGYCRSSVVARSFQRVVASASQNFTTSAFGAIGSTTRVGVSAHADTQIAAMMVRAEEWMLVRDIPPPVFEVRYSAIAPPVRYPGPSIAYRDNDSARQCAPSVMAATPDACRTPG